MKSHCIILVALFPVMAGAQVLRPLDRTKQADVNDKSIPFGDAELKTLSQPARNLSDAPLSKGDLKLQNFQTKDVNLNTVPLSTVSTPTLPKANFTAKRITDRISDATRKQAGQTKRKTPINQRQIKPFTPGGEEELKKQLNEPH